MALKLPICNFDAKTGILCSKCESKLRNGQISQADVRVSKALVQLSEKFSELNRVTLVRATEVDGGNLLEVEPADVRVLRSNPQVSQKLRDELKGTVWIAGVNSSDRQFLEDVLYPIQIVTVNTVWLPDGGKRTKVIVASRFDKKGMAELARTKELAKAVRGIDLVVEPETEQTLWN